MTEKDIAKMSLDDKKDGAAPAAAPFQFNFSSTAAPAAAPAAGAAPAGPFQFNFASAAPAGGAAPAQFSFNTKGSAEGAELAEPDDDDEDGEGGEDFVIKHVLSEMEPWSRVRVLNLLAISKVRDQLRAEYRAEVRELMRKYEKLCEPLDAKRAAIINGAAIVENPSDEAKASLQKLGAEDASKPIEHFWLKAMHQCSRVAGMIEEQDEAVLEHLVDIRCASLEEGVGFRLEFEFSENPFFTNKVLTKTYVEDDGEEAVLIKVEGTEINWNAGKSTCFRMVKKKTKSGGKNKQKKVVMSQEKCPSFFHFFSPSKVPTEEDEKTMDDEELQERDEECEQDYGVGVAFRDGIVPDAVSYFLGLADDDDEDGWNFEDEDGMEGEEDDEEEEDEEDDRPQGGRRGGGGGGGGGRRGGAPHRGGGMGGGRGGRGGPNPADCKQQ